MEQLNKIEKWPINSTDDIKNLIDYIRRLWWYSETGFVLKGKQVLRLELHTYGWSGNEDIIRALRKNDFWLLFWEKSTRGGHYWFKIPLF